MVDVGSFKRLLPSNLRIVALKPLSFLTKSSIVELELAQGGVEKEMELLLELVCAETAEGAGRSSTSMDCRNVGSVLLRRLEAPLISIVLA